MSLVLAIIHVQPCSIHACVTAPLLPPTTTLSHTPPPVPRSLYVLLRATVRARDVCAHAHTYGRNTMPGVHILHGILEAQEPLRNMGGSGAGRRHKRSSCMSLFSPPCPPLGASTSNPRGGGGRERGKALCIQPAFSPARSLPQSLMPPHEAPLSSVSPSLTQS